MNKYANKTDSEILYIFALDVLKILQPDGAWSTTEPAPLTPKQIETELLRVRDHPLYARQKLMIEADDGTYVTLDNGVIATYIQKGATA